ncbi:MAG: polysaccharide deacetylase family protein [Nanoarchaeota archaeon]|nr:polysaccharide deacetylase family protein [Nanoarchaeota archaeon]
MTKLITRYGFSSSKMTKNLLQFSKASPAVTWPITAKTLESHYTNIPKAPNVEYAVHGCIHVDYSKLSAETLKKHLHKALQIFHTYNINVCGFRAPYLQWNNSDNNVLKSLGFLYNSSSSIHWDVVPEKYLNKSYDLALTTYKPIDANQKQSLPFIKNDVVCIPVSLPDDEILIDRLGIKDQNILFKVWMKILEQTNERGELFVLQLHPERFHLANHALANLIKAAKQKSVWVTTLKDVAEWWKTHANDGWPENYKSAFCITGDIDVMSIWDYRFMREDKK